MNACASWAWFLSSSLKNTCTAIMIQASFFAIRKNNMLSLKLIKVETFSTATTLSLSLSLSKHHNVVSLSLSLSSLPFCAPLCSLTHCLSSLISRARAHSHRCNAGR